MTEQELELSKIKSNIRVNENALENSKRLFRDLKIQEMEPAWYADSIFSGVDLIKELDRTLKHIFHIEKEIGHSEKMLFKYKLRHGEIT